jgi:D-alanyl-D-alanine carboxypeptidase (penicillin-binding protein 5/6)
MLATYEAGTVPEFVAEMNRTARSLGMDKTTYTDPSGYDPATVSDASDQLRVFQRATRFAVFRQVVSMPSATLPVAGTLQNFDPIIPEGYYGKTGSDSAAEGCLAFFKYVTIAGRRLTVVGVVMGQGYGSATSVILGAAGAAAERLVGSVTPSIRVHTVVPARTTVLVATSADGKRTGAVTSDPLTVIGWGGMRERLAIQPRPVGVDLDAGQRLGDARLVGPLPTPSGAKMQTAVRAAKELDAPGLSWRLGHLL